ncbi:MAG: type II toxin-antitoxin system RelE/ParE family toxin [Rhodocyclaceae bacterium]|nr:type II toxin-antitoxin system RelE/ParE family toxin [Rhodocyclaceae bacterium]
MQLVFLPQAELDLEVIGDYIARNNPCRAASFVRELQVQCRKLVKSPKAYRPRPELGKAMRSCAYGNYLIIFAENAGLVQIVRILHGAMDVEAQFAERNSAPDDKT